jgi:SulP family sulfate permease
LIGAFLVYLSRRYKHWLILPVSLLSFNLLFHVIFNLANISIEKAQSLGWLIQVSVENNNWHFFNLFELKNLNSAIFISQLLNHFNLILSIAFLSAITLLLNVNGLELSTQHEFDLNKELRSAGFANLCASFFCGLTGYHSFGTSLLSYKIGSRTHWFSLFSLIFGFSGLIFGPSLVTLFPKPVLGGLLIFLGLSLLVEWVYDSYFKIKTMEYLNLLLILLVMVLVGFLQGFANSRMKCNT